MKQKVKEKVYTENKALRNYKIFKNIVKRRLHSSFRRAKISIKSVPRFQTATILHNQMKKSFLISWKYVTNYSRNTIILIWCILFYRKKKRNLHNKINCIFQNLEKLMNIKTTFKVWMKNYIFIKISFRKKKNVFMKCKGKLNCWKTNFKLLKVKK